MLEVAATEDQEPVETLPAHAADPAFGVGVRVRRLDRRSHDLDAFAAEDAVEGAAELRVAVVNQKARPRAAVVDVHQQVPRLLGHPGRIRLARTGDVFVSIGKKNSTYSRLTPTVSTVNKTLAMIVFACWRRKERQLEAARAGAGGMPARASTLRTSVAETVIPSLRNSPTIRT